MFVHTSQVSFAQTFYFQVLRKLNRTKHVKFSVLYFLKEGLRSSNR